MKRTPPQPWTKVSEGPEHDFHIFKIRTVQAADPRDGKAHSRVLLDAPDWVNVLALTEDDQAVMIRQFRYGTWSITLELPGGMIEPGEDVSVGCARELEEETGYRPAQMVPLGFCHPNPAIQGNKLHCFLALGCQRVSDGAPDATEDIAVELVPRAALAGLVRDGTITHSAVLAGLYLADLKR